MIATFVAAFSVMFGAQAAFAYGAVNGSMAQYYVAGHWYDTYPTVYTQPASYALASTRSSFTGGGTYAGWAGARGRLFTSDNYLSCEGVNSYNPSQGSLAESYSCYRYQPYNWYSWGVSRGWNGSGYNDFYTSATILQGNY
ncbi:hypothetical protein ACIPY3_14790 [Paenarthrobacter sp. NPDC089714]|uniref:hypothetical protein n=1 Tax=Paenarthrobacter sp. NPDC089714 TaxID=3364377 RepID=UPI0038023339